MDLIWYALREVRITWNQSKWGRVYKLYKRVFQKVGFVGITHAEQA